jgi:2-C-methyl-D-erythritol 4-phosphate cytidylyltransferase
VKPDVVVLIPAGGVGLRLGLRTPKQFLRIGASTILATTLRHFTRHPAVRAVVIAAPAAHLPRTRALTARLRGRTTVEVVEGGTTRQESVWRALQAAPADVPIVLVHDGVRPFITPALIEAIRAGAEAHGAVLCALPIVETVKRVVDGVVESTLDRSTLWAVQTPQGFRAPLLREAHEKAIRDGIVGTDDAMLVERLGHPVRVVPGLAENVKITTPADLRAARRRR